MSYLPLSNDGLLNWSANFSTKIQAEVDPTVIGLSVADVDAYRTAQTDYATKLLAATQPETRGGATINAKDISKKELIRLSRLYGMAVTNFPSVTDEQRYEFGLTIRDTEPSPIGRPETMPVIEFEGVNGNRVNFRMHDSESSGRGKPKDVTGAFIYTYVGDEAPIALSDWKFEGTSSRNDAFVDFPLTVEPGTKVWLTAAWVNAKLETGDACPAVFTYLNHGSVQQAA